MNERKDDLQLDFAAVQKTRMNSRAEIFTPSGANAAAPSTSCATNDSAPPEKLLQAVWQHQRLQRDQLKTADGKSVRVLHPGFASVEGGPDFRGAVLQIGDETPRFRRRGN